MDLWKILVYDKTVHFLCKEHLIESERISFTAANTCRNAHFPVSVDVYCL